MGEGEAPRFINGLRTASVANNEARGIPPKGRKPCFHSIFRNAEGIFLGRFVHTLLTSSILCPPETETGMEGWNTETSWNRDVLERIVVLLFALANLADLAAGVPFSRRRRVLGILGRGEAEARAFLFGMAPGAPVPADAPEDAGDAARLAIRLRALALVLCAMLGTGQFVLPDAIGPQAGRPSHGIFAPVVGWRGAPAQPAPDTS